MARGHAENLGTRARGHANIEGTRARRNFGHEGTRRLKGTQGTQGTRFNRLNWEGIQKAKANKGSLNVLVKMGCRAPLQDPSLRGVQVRSKALFTLGLPSICRSRVNFFGSATIEVLSFLGLQMDQVWVRVLTSPRLQIDKTVRRFLKMLKCN